MSHINGIWYFDGRPLPENDEAWVLSGTAASHGCPAQLRRGSGLLMAQWPSAFDGPDLDFAQAGGDLCALDGAIHNREDLRRRFGYPSASPAADAILPLRLYRDRGPDGLVDLIGDWSLVIADAQTRSVQLASDYAGIRPLYYLSTGSYVAWSSSLAQMARQRGSNEIDAKYAADFLTKGSSSHRTPYRDVYPVPPGCVVGVSNKGVSIRAFWDLPVDKETRYANPDEYAGQLLHLFREAVAARMPADAPVCAELSGGLDSSSIVCMAAEIAERNSAPKPIPFTYIAEDLSDEKYARVVERARGLQSIRLDLQNTFVTADQPGNAAPAWWGPRFAELRRQLAAKGASTLLTGQTGDFVMGNMLDDSGQAVEYLQQGDWRGALRETYAWSQALRIPIYPLLWRVLRTAFTPFTPSAPTGASASRETSLTARLQREISRAEHPPLPASNWRQAPPASRSRFRMFSGILDARQLQTPEWLQDIYYSHPYAHRPLVEFMLTVPAGEICRPGEPRRLMRRAFANLLPPAILKRQSKSTYGGAFRTALTPLAQEMIAHSGQIRLVSCGYADAAALNGRLQRFVQGLECNEVQLRSMLLFEFWLRNREGAASSSDKASANAATDYQLVHGAGEG